MILFDTADNDFDSVLNGFTITFGTSGPEIRQLEIGIVDDNFYEDTEIFTAVIASNNPELSRISLNTTVVTILDEDSKLLKKSIIITCYGLG